MLSSKRLTRSPGYPLCLVWLVFALATCAPWHDPTTDNDAPLRARAVTEESHSVRVSAAVLSAEDSKRMFGADLYAVNVQPVWLEVTNRTAQSLWLFRTGADGGHFLPFDVVWALHPLRGGPTNVQVDDPFYKLAFKNPIPPGTARAGILFTNPDRGTKLCNIELSAKSALIHFSLFLPVPDDGGLDVPLNNARTSEERGELAVRSLLAD
ncbi:UNVERIFIED_ORG: hypothetical protein BDU10_7220 [Burkholderia sp. CF145]|uniref:hypothetical protein n=2 Tax=Burkholderiaceae TaxID=119060 RepID=UPI0009C9B4DF|nr:hypothetical protein [Paraburkholderia hospita]SKD03571.1 hypothetical protein SAMN06266956_8231 [Paraburkholderia hospita]